MRLAIFSDLHDLTEGMQRVLRDAEQRQVDRVIYLGDTGHDQALFATLQAEAIACTFGNWEVSGYRRLPTALASWVAGWPATLRHDDVLFCHATPDMSPQVTTTADAAQAMRQGLRWHQLFPRLHLDEEARWQALAALEAEGLQVAFHGHTHVQQVWRYGDRRWRQLGAPHELHLESGDDVAGAAVDAPTPPRYLIGVGSAGAPQDGTALRYAVYDSTARAVTLIRLDAPNANY